MVEDRSVSSKARSNEERAQFSVLLFQRDIEKAMDIMGQKQQGGPERLKTCRSKWFCLSQEHGRLAPDSCKVSNSPEPGRR